MDTCGRTTQSGAGFTHVCERPKDHPGAHMSHSRNERDEIISGMTLTWTHENWQGHAVWPETRGAQDVTNKA